jgi:hypothetical protein
MKAPVLPAVAASRPLLSRVAVPASTMHYPSGHRYSDISHSMKEKNLDIFNTIPKFQVKQTGTLRYYLHFEICVSKSRYIFLYFKAPTCRSSGPDGVILLLSFTLSVFEIMGTSSKCKYVHGPYSTDQTYRSELN